jgi:hypothetical protein
MPTAVRTEREVSQQEGKVDCRGKITPGKRQSTDLSGMWVLINETFDLRQSGATRSNNPVTLHEIINGRSLSINLSSKTYDNGPLNPE